MKSVMDRAALDKFLWQSASLLRGHVSAGEYQIYIFALLFLKRICDQAADHTTGGTGPTFVWPMPDGWRSLAERRTEVGQALNDAASALEAINPQLAGILTSVDFDSGPRLGPQAQRDRIWRNLIRQFGSQDLSNAALANPDLLGDAYEFLLKNFAEGAGRKAGEFYTPREVVTLLVAVLDPQPANSVYDPTCGTGGMLIEAAVALRSQGARIDGSRLYGQEANANTWAICRMNMMLHGLAEAHIEHGDTLRNPRFLDTEHRVAIFDRVIANPPFSLANWGRDDLKHDEFNRFRLGLPPESKGDLAFVQHMLASCAPDGKAAIVLPLGVLSRGNSEGAIRSSLVSEDLVDTVIALPSNLFYGSLIPASILVLNKQKGERSRGRIRFIDGSDHFSPERGRNRLAADHVSSLIRMARDDGLSGPMRLVPLSEVIASGGDLTPQRYIARVPTGHRPETRHLMRGVERYRVVLTRAQRDASPDLEQNIDLAGLWATDVPAVSEALGAVVTSLREVSLPGTDQSFRYVGLEHIEPGELRIRSWARRDAFSGPGFRFERGDVLFGKLRPNLRKVALAEFRGVCSQEILVLRPRGEGLLAEFLALGLQSEALRAWAVRTARGSKMPRTSWAELAGFQLQLPPLEVQRRICEVTSRLRRLGAAARAYQMALRDCLDAVVQGATAGDVRQDPQERLA